MTNTYVGETGWMEGLPIVVNDYAAGNGLELKRSSWTKWTQDDVNSADTQNPRVTETKIGDGVNLKRSTIDYLLYPSTTISKFGLVSAVNVNDTNQSTVLKRAETDYNLTAAYLNRRIIGVPLETRVYGYENSQLGLVSKMTYGFDEGDFTQEPNQIIAPIRHETAKYGSNFIVGRGNMTSTTRHDVTGQTASVTSRVVYDIAGSPVAQFDPLNRRVAIDYTDVFNDNQNRNGFAYPTTVTDPAGNSSTVIYRHDIGANVRAQSPAPNGQSQGKITERDYDSIGRLSIDKIVNHGGAYTRYEYPNNGIQSKVFSTIIDTNNNGADTADEVLSESWTDGAGRTRMSRTEHPGSIGGYSGSLVEYDLLGRAKRQSVPTEIGGNWNFPTTTLWKSEEFDWKGRTTKSTNTDGTFSEASYEGCGCAGGDTVTVEGEQLAEGRRKQKVYSDTLGRQYKSEVLNWDGSVYSATVTKFNGRDQALWVKQYDGAAPPDALTTDSCPIPQQGQPQSCQITKLTYDGHGRLQTKHAPQQNVSSNGTIYEYYQDDRLHQVSDARGATTAYTYNSRGLVTNISSVLPTIEEYQTFTTPPISPTGWLDGVSTSTWIARGWSFDQNNSSASNYVHIYIDGPAGQGGTYVGEVHANLPRPDVNAAMGVTGNHGFEFTIPTQYRDGAQHTLYAYGIDTGADPNTMLLGSPKLFSFDPATVVPSLNTSTSFEYDDAGNRLWMTDNLGRTDYTYDTLSRLTSETRQITDTMLNGNPLVMANAPLANNSFRLQYSYGLAGQLSSLTDPYGAVVNYAYDQTGRLNGVTGSTFGNVTNYATGAKYEAWGALKELNSGSGLKTTMSYDDRLQPETYNLSPQSGSVVMNKNYDYYADGNLSYTQDLLDPKFDRLQTYDHLGRIKQGKSGLEARGGTVPDNEQSTNLPYRQNYQFNAFNNLTQRNNKHWGVDNWYGQNNNLSYTYQNNRIQGSGWQYDADGRNLQTAAPDDWASSQYNAAGQMVHSSSQQSDAVRWYDGNGREVKRLSSNLVETETQSLWVRQSTKYYIRSSVLGNEVVSEVWANGKKGKTFIRAAGAQIAWQSAHATEIAMLNEAVFFEYTDASGMSQRTSDKNGVVINAEGGEGSPAETDPMGGNVGMSTPYIELLPPWTPQPEYPMLLQMLDDSPMYVNGQRMTCSLDGFAIGCSRAMDMLETGSAIPAALGQYQHLPGFRFTSHGVGVYSTYIPGHWVNLNIPDDPNSTSVRTDIAWVAPRTQFFNVPISNISWAPPRQTQQQQTLTIKNIIDEAKRVLNEIPSCRGIFEPDVDPTKLLSDFEKGIIGNISFGALQSPPGFTVNATTIPGLGQPINTVDHLGFPIKVSTGFSNVNITLNNILASPGRERYGLNTLQDRVLTLIHELGHAANLIRNNFANANPTASAILDDDVSRPAVSKNNSDFVWANCFGPLSRLTQTGGLQ